MSRNALALGSHGRVTTHQRGASYRAICRYRDYDGVTRQVQATGRTANGGRHFYYRPNHPEASRNTQAKLAPGIDTRGAGGYVVAPTSVVTTDQRRRNPDGTWTVFTEPRPYEVVSALGTPIAVIPAEVELELVPRSALLVRRPVTPVFDEPRHLARLIPYGSKSLADEVAALGGVKEGRRHSALLSSSVRMGTLVGAGALQEPDAVQGLLRAATTMDPPYPADQAARDVRDGLTYGARFPRDLSFLFDASPGRSL